jgi:hypothetical protein
VIARIDYLSFMDDVPIEERDGDPDYEELTALRALADEGDTMADWEDGATLIRDSYFETYAQELADELGLLQGLDQWPATCIDWEQAARELQTDYTSVDFDGVTYWARS